ncbi:hypothetical protein BV20DRAFT_540798 [Pilatotrama ljubarskyi]|nr:hypothetical protein BV20DRAFT_540798 [Pilatotrama ljubarskyi]
MGESEYISQSSITTPHIRASRPVRVCPGEFEVVKRVLLLSVPDALQRQASPERSLCERSSDTCGVQQGALKVRTGSGVWFASTRYCSPPHCYLLRTRATQVTYVILQQVTALNCRRSRGGCKAHPVYMKTLRRHVRRSIYTVEPAAVLTHKIIVSVRTIPRP